MLILTDDMLQSLTVESEDGSQAHYIGAYQIDASGPAVKSIHLSSPHVIDGVCLAREEWCGLMPQERKTRKKHA